MRVVILIIRKWGPVPLNSDTSTLPNLAAGVSLPPDGEASSVQPQAKPTSRRSPFLKVAQRFHDSQMLFPLVVSAFKAMQKMGVSVTPNHFYWPIPDIAHLEKRQWPEKTMPVGVDLRMPEQVNLLQNFAAKYGSEWTFPEHPVDGLVYHYNNGLFESIDSEIAYSMVRHFAPSRIIEIGGGYSTRILSAALRKNFHESGIRGELITVDPYCDPALSNISTLIRKPVQDVEMDLFLTLGENDILFVDSSHVISVGSDAVFEYLEVIPRLRKGVVIHAHDIFLPSDYPREPVLKNMCFWSEQYLLQGFLSLNPSFEVLWGSSSMQAFHPEVLDQHFPRWGQSYDKVPHEKRRFVPTIDNKRTWPSSFWMKRIA
jgi:hypothetical protein